MYSESRMCSRDEKLKEVKEIVARKRINFHINCWISCSMRFFMLLMFKKTCCHEANTILRWWISFILLRSVVDRVQTISMKLFVWFPQKEKWRRTWWQKKVYIRLQIVQFCNSYNFYFNAVRSFEAWKILFMCCASFCIITFNVKLCFYAFRPFQPLRHFDTEKFDIFMFQSKPDMPAKSV